MKTFKSIVIFGVFFSVCFGASVDLSQYEYAADINMSPASQAYYKIDLTEEVYNVCRCDLHDIRIVSADNRQVPYVLVKGIRCQHSHELRGKTINRTIKGLDSLLTIDLGKRIKKNSLNVFTSGLNFRRQVVVEGSNNNTDFYTLIPAAYVFAVQTDQVRRFPKIDLPVNDYRYLRVTVSAMSSEDKAPEIEGLSCFVTDKENSKTEAVAITLISHTEDEKKKTDIYEYDLGYKNLPTAELVFEIEDADFYRFVTLEGRNAEKRKILLDSEDNVERYREVEEAWHRVTSAAIYRYEQEEKVEKLSVELGGRTCYRFLKITVNNYDNSGVSMKNLIARISRGFLVFEGRSDQNAVLYAGSKDAKKPVYDIERTLTDPRDADASMVTLTSLRLNPAFGTGEKEAAWSESHGWLLMVVLILAVGVLGIFIFKSFKSIAVNTNQEGTER